MKQKLITIILTITILLVPLARLPITNGCSSIKICILTACAFLLLILILANYKQLTLEKKDWLLLIWAILIFLSAINSSDRKVSIIGARTRYEGVLAFYSYIIIYLSAKKFLEYSNKKTLIIVINILYIIVSILGILQYYKIQPINDFWKPLFIKSVSGTFGNSNFMGSFLSMGIPIFVIIYTLKGSKISFLTSLIVFFNLLTCRARSGWVAFVVFGIMLVIYLIKNKNMIYFKRAIILLLCFLVIFTGLYMQKNSRVKSKVTSIKKDIEIVATKGINNKLGSGRIQIWKISLDLIRRYPLLGVGTDNLKKGVLNNLTQTSVNFISRSKTIPDKAHNEYLNIAVTQGIPAAIIYMVFVSIVLLSKLKLMFKQEYTFILSSVIISYLVQAFFNISIVGVAPLFWFAMGILDNKKLKSTLI